MGCMSGHLCLAPVGPMSSFLVGSLSMPKQHLTKRFQQCSSCTLTALSATGRTQVRKPDMKTSAPRCKSPQNNLNKLKRLAD
jgi:hypothetical protein